MNTNFKHDALLYAAVCTGSYKSYLNLRLIQKLGFEDSIVTDSSGSRTVELPVYFPEAVPHPSSSRSSSPAPHLPTLTVDFQVVEHASSENDKCIQIFIGSDVLREHSADILFSSNSMTLFDKERTKLSIPLVRPESEEAFQSLFITTTATSAASLKKEDDSKEELLYLNGLGQDSSAASVSSIGASPPPSKYRPPGVIAAEMGSLDSTKDGPADSEPDVGPSSRQPSVARPSLSLINTRADAREQTNDSTSQNTPSRSGISPAVWSSWRRDITTTPVAPAPAAGPNLDWASAGKSRETAYQRKDTGIKVLKPKTATRTFSTTAASSALGSGSSSTDGRSRFFDEGRRRSELEPKSTEAEAKVETSAPASASASGAVGTAPKTKANPIGGASAFSWLNPGGGAK